MINVTFFALDAGYAATVAHWLLREAEGTACFSPQPFYPLPPLEHPYSLTEGDSHRCLYSALLITREQVKTDAVMDLDLNGFRPESLLQPTWRFSLAYFSGECVCPRTLVGAVSANRSESANIQTGKRNWTCIWPLTQLVRGQTQPFN